MKNKPIVLFLLFVLVPIFVVAQRERNYIYVLDCTASMDGYNGSPKVWKTTKDYLRNELEKHVSGTSLHVIPFQGKVLDPIEFDRKDLDWGKIEKTLDKYIEEPTNTNICDAWDATDQYMDLHKDNYIILLTDGKDNVKGKKNPNAVAEKLKAWCGRYRNSWAFYVQLTEAAIDEGVIKVINACENEFIIDASKGIIPTYGSFDNDQIYANTLNLSKEHRISFSTAGQYPATVVCTDPYFDVKVVDGKIVNGIFTVKIEAKKTIDKINSELPEIYDFSFDIQSDKVSILNPTIQVQMTNKAERSLEILSGEVSMGKATWYDSFLFWGESNPDTRRLELKGLNAKFNKEAITDGASVDIQIEADGSKDYQLFFNGKSIDNRIITLDSRDNKKSELSVVFNPNAKEGKHYLTIRATRKHELDKINDNPVTQYELTLRSEYVVKWNPMKTFLMWLAFIVIAALLLWFLLVRRIVFPTFCFDNLQVIYSDGESKKGREDCSLHGARKIICSASPKPQSTLNKLFFGRIEYLKNPFWVTSVVMKPCGSNGITISEEIKGGDVAAYRMTSMITPQNGPRRPFVVKRVKTDLLANISIG